MTYLRCVRIFLAVAVGLVVLAGCGGGNPDESAITKTVKGFGAALGSASDDKACKLFTAQEQASYADSDFMAGSDKHTCAGGLTNALGDNADQAAPIRSAWKFVKVGSIQVRGSEAEVSVSSASGHLGPSVKLQKVGGHWLLSSVS